AGPGHGPGRGGHPRRARAARAGGAQHPGAARPRNPGAAPLRAADPGRGRPRARRRGGGLRQALRPRPEAPQGGPGRHARRPGRSLTMSSSSDSRDYSLIERLAEEFAERLRRGERPSPQEYFDRYPEVADDLRELLPAAEQLEQAQAQWAAAAGRAAPAVPPLPHLTDFHILRVVGRGGMGVVYEAEQVSLGRRVALKVLTQKLHGDARQKRRFEREARAAARLHHTNIVPVFGVGEADGVPYYVMQFVQGTGLGKVV